MALPVFGEYSAWETYFDLRTGADAPHLYYSAAAVQSNMSKVRDFYTRVLQAYFHPASLDGPGFLAQVGRARSVATVLRDPETYSNLMQVYRDHQEAFDKARLDTTRLEELAAGVARQARGALPLTQRDLRLLDDMTGVMDRASSDVTLSPLLKAVKHADKQLALFRMQCQKAGPLDWMRHSSIVERLRVARRIGRADAFGDDGKDDAVLDPVLPELDAASGIVPVAAAPSSAPTVEEPLTPAQVELGDQYIGLVTASRSAKVAYETSDPVLLALTAFRGAVNTAYATADVAKWIAAVKAAESNRGKTGQRDGSALEQEVWAHCHPCLRAAIAGWGDADLLASVAGGRPAFTPIEDVELSSGVAATPLVLVRNVECIQGKRLIGELDGLLVDTRRGQAACVMEVKKTPSDLCYARAQRNRLTNALRRAIKEPTNEAFVMKFRVKGPHAPLVERLTASSEGPWKPIDIGFFSTFLEAATQRWIFVTRGDLGPEAAPVCSKIAHVVTRELAQCLAASPFQLPATPTPADAAAAVAALTDAELVYITKSISIAWAKTCGTPDDDDLRWSAGKLRAEGWSLRAPVEGGFVVPIVVWANATDPSP